MIAFIIGFAAPFSFLLPISCAKVSGRISRWEEEIGRTL